MVKIKSAMWVDEALRRTNKADCARLQALQISWSESLELRVNLNKNGAVWAAFCHLRSAESLCKPFDMLQFPHLVTLASMYLGSKFDLDSNTEFLRPEPSLFRNSQVRGLALHGYALDDQSLRVIAQVSKLRIFNLFYSTVTGPGVLDLQTYNLYCLRLVNCSIPNSAFPLVRGLTKLRVLDLGGTLVTDESILEIADIGSLQRLNIRGTGISRECYEQLLARLPRCTINWSPVVSAQS